MTWLLRDNTKNSKYELIRHKDRKTLLKVTAENSNCGVNGFCCDTLAQLNRTKMRPYIITISNDVIGDNFYLHYGETFMLVLKGVLEFTAGERTEVLKEGDSVYLDAEMELGFHGKDGSEVMVLVVKMTD